MTSIIQNVTPSDACQKEEGNFLEGRYPERGGFHSKDGSKPGGNYVANSDCFVFSLTKFKYAILP